MLSKEMTQQIQMLKQNYVAYPDIHATDWNTLRTVMLETSKQQPISKGICFTQEKIAGVPVEWGKPEHQEKNNKLIFHVHGGGFSIGAPQCDRYALSGLAARTGWNTISIDYRLAPEYKYPAPIEDCMKVYTALLEQGYSAGNICFLGESAGGAIVLSLAAYCKKHGIPMPGAICSVSPSVDFNFASKSLHTYADREMIVNCNVAEQVRDLYFGDQDPSDPVASPVFSDVSGWPPVYLYVATEEILFDESLRMYLKLEDSNIPVKLSVAEGLYHCFMFNPSPESEEALDQISQFFVNSI